VFIGWTWWKRNRIKFSKPWNLESNGCNGKDSLVYTNLPSCLYPLSSKFLTQRICHMCTCKPKYWCAIMYGCEKSLAPHELSYLGILKFFPCNCYFKKQP